MNRASEAVILSNVRATMMLSKLRRYACWSVCIFDVHKMISQTAQIINTMHGGHIDNHVKMMLTAEVHLKKPLSS